MGWALKSFRYHLRKQGFLPNLGPEVPCFRSGNPWVPGAQSRFPVSLGTLCQAIQTALQHPKPSVFLQPFPAKSQDSWFLAILLEVPWSPLPLPQAQESRSQRLSLKLRNLAPNPPPSDPGIQSPGLPPQIQGSRTQAFSLRPGNPLSSLYLNTHAFFFFRTYVGSSMLGWTKWMRRDTMWKQKLSRTSPR